MGAVLQALIFTLIGILLLWFGFTLFFATPGGLSIPVFKKRGRGLRPKNVGVPGMPRTCPVCSAKLENGERVKSAAFPSMGGADRFMHISGCLYCLEGGRSRVCPVCGIALREDEFLIARLFEKPGRSHVHVLGCTRCKLRRLQHKR
jgi:predicted nucleic acid-binding Zn ribbon protein